MQRCCCVHCFVCLFVLICDISLFLRCQMWPLFSALQDFLLLRRKRKGFIALHMAFNCLALFRYGQHWDVANSKFAEKKVCTKFSVISIESKRGCFGFFLFFTFEEKLKIVGSFFFWMCMKFATKCSWLLAFHIVLF